MTVAEASTWCRVPCCFSDPEPAPGNQSDVGARSQREKKHSASTVLRVENGTKADQYMHVYTHINT